MKKEIRKQDTQHDIDLSVPLDCACLIHSTGYDWVYVDRLYNMLSRHISRPIRFHVYTEPDRAVPKYMIKHELEDWGIGGWKRSWWYKLQLFNSAHHCGPLLYFDLDTVVTGNLDWVWQLNSRYFWAVKDFKHLWRNNHSEINSSVMWWDTNLYNYVWQQFQELDLNNVLRRYQGDQDYLSRAIPHTYIRKFDETLVKSWRWQALDGGYDFTKKQHRQPGTGTNINNGTAILVFHGHPKPHELHDPVIVQYWQ